MDRLPVDSHDLVGNRDFEPDAHLRGELIGRGVYLFPQPVKQWSISAAHAMSDIDESTCPLEDVLENCCSYRILKGF